MSVRKLGHDCKEACRLRRSRPSIEVVNVDLLFKFTFSTTPPGPLGGVGALVKEFSSSTPAPMTTVDLRIDILTDPTPETAPDGWAFFEFRMLDLGLGWTVDEATAWGADGTPLAISRQRRKLLPQRGA